MFKNARLKLTAWYLVIIMAVSLALSIFIYKVQVREIERLEFALRVRQERQFEQFLGNRLPPPFVLDPDVLEDARQRIIVLLAVVNGGIFVVAGGLGYFLAGRTLKPIQVMLDEQNRFISDASHELKTPLTSLKSAFEVYLRNKKPNLTKAKTLVEESLLETNKLQQLAESLLLLAQYKKINGNSEFKKVEIESVISESIGRIKAKAIKSNIKIKENGNNFEVLGDRDRLVDLLIILLDNAIKYSKKGDSIAVSTATIEGGGQIKIKDMGVGISEEDLPYIFDRFYRADVSRSKTQIDGYGLGLAIAKEIITHHKGKIEVVSEIGKGSIFTVTLPLA
ncbi:MAG: Integral membrane sensor signal transduction histidine kinase [Candidatus Woesebacteria bacterium GW2011_GWB1_38_8]|uniref:histidine kinase n=1 Tax=Candidatus Woesebacteria bacterium GW2011_GWB1_38_8 TaxID=1618570 RepID=A0A0G0L2F5_9BACT|nr:MAG: Integral membrane sensor signal transduction histidine kinase [Candidatus Woesebacteria bacterium GW2011_GWB1_38_8]KKR30082.1 MAG: hypothetical protein UT62_C0021G0003 [Parcubacteria group bacterium GW2011_GWC1_39_8]